MAALRIRKTGFTLVELLIVIAILAVLLSILVPALKMAREQAKRALCLTRNRQLTLAWVFYADENEGRIISAETWKSYAANCWVTGEGGDSPEGSVRSWNGHSMEGENSLINGKLWRYLEDINVYKCPSDDRPSKPVRSYVINDYLNGRGSCFVPPGKGVAKKLTSLGFASETLTFIEDGDSAWSNGPFLCTPLGHPYEDYLYDQIGIYHNEGVCLGFADGHAAYQKWFSEEMMELCLMSTEAFWGSADNGWGHRLTDLRDLRKIQAYVGTRYP